MNYLKTFLESVKISDYKKWSSNLNKKFYDEMGEYFKTFNDHSKNYDRIYFDFNINPEDFEIRIPSELADFFRWNSISVIDYNKGLCKYQGEGPIRIGKVLNNLGENELLQVYNKSKENTLRNLDDIQIVISRHPYDIIGMSTDRGWTTCHDLNDKRYGGYHLHNIAQYLNTGCLVVYVIRKKDRNIKIPISRCMIFNIRGILRVDENIYGTYIPGLKQFLQNWIDDYYKSGY